MVMLFLSGGWGGLWCTCMFLSRLLTSFSASVRGGAGEKKVEEGKGEKEGEEEEWVGEEEEGRGRRMRKKLFQANAVNEVNERGGREGKNVGLGASHSRRGEGKCVGGCNRQSSE